ncbi:MAG: glycosyltransferase family 2 protein [Bacteroidetes bacterium]|nr:glycosyltransferase family 2 protein [Bacteroidota bacterium]
MTSTSLLISTYNWPEALDLCLKSVFDQDLPPGEIVICDDGSTKTTEDVVKKYQAKKTIPVVHVWQKDEGFKLGQIRNKGIAKATGDYIIQIDGDLILHKDFIRDHLNLAKQGFFTTGSRVLLSPDTTENLIENKSTDVKKYSKNNRNFFNGLRIPILHNLLSKRYKTSGKYTYYVKGCNMAFWKKDLLKINGYNENFTGWGKEDSEIAIRLINTGIKKQFLKFGGITYHLYHKEASREMEQVNFRMMQQAMDKKIVRTLKGVDQYL